MKKRIHIKSTPIHIQKIVSKYGVEKSAKSLGITPTAIHKYIKLNEAPQVTEMAAQMIFERDTAPNAQKSVLIKGDAEFLGMLAKLTKNMHGSYTAID